MNMEHNKILRKVSGSLLLALLLIVAGISSGCSEADGANDGSEEVAEAPRRMVRVETKMVVLQSFEERIALTGIVEAKTDVTISAEAGGRVDWVAELGTRVAVGTVVARFDDRLLKSGAAAAEAEYELAEATFKRQQALFADSVISALEFENAQTRRDQARAAYFQANKMYEDTQLKSPTAGRVEARYVEAGELVNPGTPVVRVVDTRNVKIRAGVPERYAADISEGAHVGVRLRALGIEGEATLSFVGRVVDPQSRTFPVEIDIDNESGLLKPEMVANVTIERRTIEEALVIPQNAIVRDDLGVSVYVIEQVDEDRIARRRDVQPGPSFGGQTVILSGLEAGEEVVVIGQSRLTDGNLVEIVGA
jgi:membrane fusion protein (multidrug efflux system)